MSYICEKHQIPLTIKWFMVGVDDEVEWDCDTYCPICEGLMVDTRTEYGLVKNERPQEEVIL